MKKLFSAFAVALLLALSAISPARSAALTDTYENSLIDWLMRGQALTPTANGYIALFTTCPTDSTGGTEVTGSGYARVGGPASAVSATLANWAGTQSAGSTVASSGSTGTTSNNNTISFPAATGDWAGPINCFGYMSASTGGTLIFYAPLTAARTITNGSTASFAPAALTFQIDN